MAFFNTSQTQVLNSTDTKVATSEKIQKVPALAQASPQNSNNSWSDF